MKTKKSEKSVAALDTVIDDEKLLIGPRALLLLRICQVSQLFRPEVTRQYWERLRKLSYGLPAEHREAFNELKAVMEPLKKKEDAESNKSPVTAVPTDPAEVKQALAARELALRKQWWWPFGKRSEWTGLVQEWSVLDRSESLRLIGKTHSRFRQTLLMRFNGQSPLTAGEWNQARRDVGRSRFFSTAEEILNQEKPVLHLDSESCGLLGDRFRAEAHTPQPIGETDERKIKARREKGLERFLKLVQCVNEDDPDNAESLMESIVSDTATANIYGDKWVERFTSVRNLVNIWVNYTQHHQKALAFLKSGMPDYMRDFVLAQWHAMISSSRKEAGEQLNELLSVCSDKTTSEAWFCVTLIRREMADVAMALAKSSTHSVDLIPRIRRGWLLFDSKSAASAISSKDLEDDIIGQFLIMATVEERVKFLRSKTRNGDTSLPEEMWMQPQSSKIYPMLSGDPPAYMPPKQTALLSLYSKTTDPDKQYKVYLRMHGYGQYSYDEIDPLLLKTLSAWDDAHPAETEKLFTRMWKAIEPDRSLLQWDLIRNAIFERCQNVFPARPESFDSLFVKWVKKTLVNQSLQWQEGQTMYTLKLKDLVPFLYCYIGAQNCAKVSPKKSDELILMGIRQYTADDDLITSGAQLYASDKGLSAMQPPIDLGITSNLEAWQKGVIQTSTKEITRLLISEE